MVLSKQYCLRYCLLFLFIVYCLLFFFIIYCFVSLFIVLFHCLLSSFTVRVTILLSLYNIVDLGSSQMLGNGTRKNRTCKCSAGYSGPLQAFWTPELESVQTSYAISYATVSDMMQKTYEIVGQNRRHHIR